MLAVGLAAALLAALLFNVGLVLQALEARRTPPELGLRLSLLWRLLHRRRWLLGQLLGTIGVGPQVLAFGLAPFVLVQPALALGLVLLLVLGNRILEEQVDAAEVIGVLAIVGGVALVAWGAPSHAETHRASVAVVGVFAGLAALALAPFPLRNTRFDSALLTVVASGSGFAATNVATKLMSDDIGAGELGNAALWAAAGLALGVVATVTGMTAFQRRKATTVVPVSTTVQTFLPIVLEPFFLRERWASAAFDGAPIGAGVLLALLGTVLLARTRAVSELAAGAQRR